MINYKRNISSKIFHSVLQTFIGVVFGLFFISSISTNIVKATVSEIFAENFEGGNLTPWDTADPEWTNTDTGTAHTGDRKARLAGPTTESILEKMVDTSGVTEELTLSFWYDTLSGWDNNDIIVVEWTDNDAVTWMELDKLEADDATPIGGTGDEWVQKVYMLPSAAEDNTDFGFRFRALVGGSDTFDLDDVLLTSGEEDTTPTPTEMPTPTLEPSPTDQPTITPTNTPSPTTMPTETPTPTTEPSPTETPTPTDMPDISPTPDEEPDEDTEDIWDRFRAFFELIFSRMRMHFMMIWS